MTDTFSSEKRSRIMANIRSMNTSPEKAVARILRRKKLRYRRYDDTLSGCPDFVLRDSKTILFVHGCFWHQHADCNRCFMPKSRVEYWQSKLERNVIRFESTSRELKKKGWKVKVIWECETKELHILDKAIQRMSEMKK